MARLTYVYRADTEYGNFDLSKSRQLPVSAGDLMMLMDLNSKGLCIDSPVIRGKELEEFTRKFNLLTSDELHQSLEIDHSTFMSVLNQCVQCVGCRRRVERLFDQLATSGHSTLDPLVLKSSKVLSISEEKMKSPQSLGTLLYRHHEVLNNLLENKLRNKTRCMLHSLDTFRSKPFSETWREVWSSMKHNCRDELALIETKELHDVLDNYLKKHKFCNGCRTKIEKAYKILVGETTTKEKGFVAALYSNIKKCHPDKHIHIHTNKIDFLDALIRRAEPEVNGSYSKLRERHAKTLEIAQEEVLTCVGMIMYERLRRIYVTLREEERACQVLAAVGVHALYRSFDMCVEKKQGISNLELLYLEMSRAEKAKEHKRELKKMKKKKKKSEKKNHFRSCDSVDASSEADEDQDEAVEIDNDEMEIVVPMNSSTVEETEVAEPHDGTMSECTSNVNISEEETIKSFSKEPQKKKKLKKQKQKSTQSKNKKKQQQQQQQQAETRSIKNGDVIASPLPRIAVNSSVPQKCNDCLASTSDCPCENDVKDSGYGSEPNSQDISRTSSVASSAEGSEVSCLDGFCDHDHENTGGHYSESEHFTQHCYSRLHDRKSPLSLQEMLDNCEDLVEDDGDCYIPQEVVFEYQCHRERVQQQRLELRATLKQNFARLCMQRKLITYSCK